MSGHGRNLESLKGDDYMRYAKDTLTAIAFVMLLPVLLILFAMAMSILICRRLFGDTGERSALSAGLDS